MRSAVRTSRSVPAHLRTVLLASAALLVFTSVPAVQAQAPLPQSNAFTSIVHQPGTETAFTLDRSMLAATDGLLNGQDPESKRVLAGLNSVTVHNYHYRDGASYDPGAFAALDGQFRATGYQHLVNANPRGGSNTTDLWLRFQGANINSVVVLTRGDRNMSAVVVDCSLRPLDLLHLSGHFGIPQVGPGAIMVPPTGAVMVPAQPPSGAVMVPAPTDQVPYNAPQYPPQQASPEAQGIPSQNAPTLKHHGADDPQ